MSQKPNSTTRAISLSPATVKAGLAVGLFAIPLVVGHPQLLVGVLINALLLVSASLIPFRQASILSILPSLAVISRGIIFATLTPFLLYLLPFIWLGNLVFMYLANYSFNRQQQPNVLSTVVGSIAKATLIGISALLLANLSLIPQALLPAMTSVQLVTALIGGLSAVAILRYLPRYTS